MKVITQNSTNLAKYLLDDDTTIEPSTSNIVVGNPPKFIIGDLNSTTTTIYTDVTDAPSDWKGNKYTYDGTIWTLNPNWTEE